MAEPIQTITRMAQTDREREAAALEHLVSTIAQNRDVLEETIGLLQELHTSGLLEALSALLAAREKVAKILVEQAVRPEVTTLLNHLMCVAGGLTRVEPETTGTLMSGLSQGIQRGQEMAQTDQKIGLFDLVRAVKDPDVNRSLKFAVGFLGGFGKALS